MGGRVEDEDAGECSDGMAQHQRWQASAARRRSAGAKRRWMLRRLSSVRAATVLVNASLVGVRGRRVLRVPLICNTIACDEREDVVRFNHNYGTKISVKKYLDENCFTNVRNGGNGIVANTHGLRVAL